MLFRSTQKSSYTIPSFDMNRSFGQISSNEQNYYRTKADLSDPDWRNQSIDNSGSYIYNTPEKVREHWNRMLEGIF